MISFGDIATVGILVFLEGVLSIDNALVLAIIARGVHPQYQRKVLTYGLFGAVAFRMIAILFASTLIHYRWIKVIGAAYLIWLAIQYFFLSKKEEDEKKVIHRGFWMTVLIVELTDIAFAVDSILAAVALSDRYWIVVTGGLIGTLLMRFAAKQFIDLLNRFPNLESTAYFLITVVGLKVMIESFEFNGMDFHDPSNPWFWTQWILMGAIIARGFRKKNR
jgi:YkoY family integral membrane protein